MKLTTVQQPVAIACLFTWVGFVCAISFLEAWLKFQAPEVTLPIGLGIGKLVFGALNKVEWFFAIVVCASTLLYSRRLFTTGNVSLLCILAVLVLQTTWLLRHWMYVQNNISVISRLPLPTCTFGS